MMKSDLLLTVICFILAVSKISAQNRRCMKDIDLDDVQSYSFRIPRSELHDYWRNTQVSYYIFGKFDESSSKEETTISAGLYRGKTLIYKTNINCDTGKWENVVFTQQSKWWKILNGTIDRNLTSCKAGDPFDLILKVNNYYAMSWIFNAQPLQHGVKLSYRVPNIFGDIWSVEAYNADRFAKNKKHVYDKAMGYSGTTERRDRLKPSVRIFSKYRSYKATRLVLTATGRAKFDRIAFGQCDVWPKGWENSTDYCQKVMLWSFARSKANLTEKQKQDYIEREPLYANVSDGLGVFGNNRVIHVPRCISKKYFDWISFTIHPDKSIPLKTPPGVDMKEATKEMKKKRYNIERSYTCCINIKTGLIRQNEFATQFGTDQCVFLYRWVEDNSILQCRAPDDELDIINSIMKARGNMVSSVYDPDSTATVDTGARTLANYQRVIEELKEAQLKLENAAEGSKEEAIAEVRRLNYDKVRFERKLYNHYFQNRGHTKFPDYVLMPILETLKENLEKVEAYKAKAETELAQTEGTLRYIKDLQGRIEALNAVISTAEAQLQAMKIDSSVYDSGTATFDTAGRMLYDYELLIMELKEAELKLKNADEASKGEAFEKVESLTDQKKRHERRLYNFYSQKKGQVKFPEYVLRNILEQLKEEVDKKELRKDERARLQQNEYNQKFIEKTQGEIDDLNALISTAEAQLQAMKSEDNTNI